MLHPPLPVAVDFQRDAQDDLVEVVRVSFPVVGHESPVVESLMGTTAGLFFAGVLRSRARAGVSFLEVGQWPVNQVDTLLRPGASIEEIGTKSRGKH